MKKHALAILALVAFAATASALTDNEALNILAGTQRLTDNAALNLLAVNGPNLIKLRRDTAANWTSENPVLAQGEVGVELSSDPAIPHKFKIGDGETAWADLPYTFQILGVPGSDSVTLIKADGTAEYLDSAALSNFLGVTTDGALNAFAAGPRSNADAATLPWANWLAIQHRISVPAVEDKLSKIANGTATILSIATVGDSYTPTSGLLASNTNRERLYRAYGYRGVFASAATNTGIYTDTVTGATARTSPGSSPDYCVPNGCVYSMPTGGAAELGVTSTAWAFNKATFVYKLGVAGTMKLQYRLSTASAWVDVTTIDTTSGSGLGTYAVTLPSLTFGSATFVRALNVTGTSVVAGALLENTNNTTGVIISNISIGGLDLTGGANTCPSANMATLLGLLVPDCVIVTFADTDISTSYPAMHTLWDTARSGMGWIHIGCHNDSSDNATPRNDEIISYSEDNGYQWFDVRTVIPTYAFAVAKGWQLDTGHLNTVGWQVASAAFWRAWNILNEQETPQSKPVVSATVSATSQISLRGSTMTDLINAARLNASIGNRGFTVTTSNNAQLYNRTAFTALSSGVPFVLAAWVQIPAATNVYNEIFATHSSATNAYTANNFAAFFNSDGTLEVRFLQGTTSDYWRFRYTSAQLTAFRGKYCLVWLWRDVNNVIRFGINDQILDFNLGQGTSTAGSGTVDPTQLISAEYVHFGRGNNNSGAVTYFGPCAFWDSDVDPRTWWTTGIIPASPKALYLLTDGAGGAVRDWSGNGNTGALTDPASWTFPRASASVMTANTTSTVTFNTTLQSETIYNTSASTIASSTITLPTASADGQKCTYFTHGAHTAVTMAGGTVVGAALTSLSADQTVEWSASATSGTWIRVK